MRSLPVSLCTAFVSIVLAFSSGAAPAASERSATVNVTATFAARTALQVSSHILRFQVTDPELPAIAIVEFSAGARTLAGADVRLLVQPLSVPEKTGGPSSGPLMVTVIGDGEGLAVLTTDSPTLAAQWTGGGRRTGRVTFQLRAAAGTYAIPVRFELIAP